MHTSCCRPLDGVKAVRNGNWKRNCRCLSAGIHFIDTGKVHYVVQLVETPFTPFQFTVRALPGLRQEENLFLNPRPRVPRARRLSWGLRARFT